MSGGIFLKIAVSGKGGVGKTTVAANLVLAFAAKGYHVYAIDADPDVSLGAVLGFPAGELASLRPVMEMQEVIAARGGGGGAFYALNPKVDDLIEGFSLRRDRISFLRMGSVKQGGTSCYCRENSFLYAVLGNLLLDRDDMVIMDMSAGIEHLTRGTSRGVDLMIIVTEPTLVSVQTAQVVRKLATELGIGRVKFLANKVRTARERDFIQSRFPPDELIGILPFAEEVLDNAMAEQSGLLGATGGTLPGMDEVVAKIMPEIPHQR
ncbi:MAG: AAA family ATPase [Firmicutes bacterium]|nr:AAA family ATPase [Bacillota bacterium]